jgi:membrane-bound lytic murein transglycosylase D
LKGSRINAGQKLIVNAKGIPAAKKTTTTAAAAKTTTKPTAAANGNAVIHVVKKGETLWSISQLYDDVNFYDLMKLNGFTKTTKIFPGDKIKIKNS